MFLRTSVRQFGGDPKATWKQPRPQEEEHAEPEEPVQPQTAEEMVADWEALKEDDSEDEDRLRRKKPKANRGPQWEKQVREMREKDKEDSKKAYTERLDKVRVEAAQEQQQAAQRAAEQAACRAADDARWRERMQRQKEQQTWMDEYIKQKYA